MTTERLALERAALGLLERGLERLGPDGGSWAKGSAGNGVNAFCSVSSLWEDRQWYREKTSTPDELAAYDRAVEHLYCSLPPSAVRAGENVAGGSREERRQHVVILHNDDAGDRGGYTQWSDIQSMFRQAVARAEDAVRVACDAQSEVQS